MKSKVKGLFGQLFLRAETPPGFIQGKHQRAGQYLKTSKGHFELCASHGGNPGTVAQDKRRATKRKNKCR